MVEDKWNFCPFCSIVAGEHPTAMLLETNEFVCFPPLEQEVPGHTLIVSRLHYTSLLDAPPSIGAGLIKVYQALSQAFRRSLGATAFNLLGANGQAAQQSVMHLHLHFLPRSDQDGIEAWPTLNKAAQDRNHIETP